MQIACPRCAASYTLDERLLPPSGAPVQCTSCNHVFNAAPPGPPAGAKTTQMFGREALNRAMSETAGALGPAFAPVPENAPPPHTTPSFGTPVVTGSAPEATANQPPSAARSTMTFGRAELDQAMAAERAKAEAAQAPAAHSTMAFGRVEVSQATAAQPATQAPSTARSTMTFGRAELDQAMAAERAKAEAAQAPAAHSTMAFGRVEVSRAMGAQAPEAAQSSSSPRSTMAFGRVEVDQAMAAERAKAEAAQPAAHSTMAFGRVEANQATTAAQSQASPRSTMAFGRVEVDQAMAAERAKAEAAQPPAAHSTMAFGRVEANQATTAAQSPASPRSTMAFGRAEVDQAMAAERAKAAEAAQPAAHSTMAFGRVDAAGNVPPVLAPSAEPQARRNTASFGAQASAPTSTVSLGSLEPTPQHSTMAFGRVSAPSPATETSRPTSMFGRVDASAPRPFPIEAAPASAPVVARAKKSTGWYWAVLLALGVISGIFYLRISHQRAEQAAALLRDEQAAFAQIRLDDPSARQQAVTALEALIAHHPNTVIARADRVIALAFDQDDLVAPTLAATQESSRLDAQAQALEQNKSTSDWQVRVNALHERERAIEANNRALHAEADRKATEIQKALAALPPPSEANTDENRAVVRAAAMAAAVRGDGDAIGLAERYHQLGGDPTWVALLEAEYAASGRAMQPAMLKSFGQMTTLQHQDTSNLRPYVLAARLAILLDHPEEATPRLEAVTALNPNHVLAHRLLDSLRETDSSGTGTDGQ